jgi:DNA invertase Pin-like site-specific DNA recombinase
MYLDQLPDIRDVQFTFGRRAKEQGAKHYVIYCRKSDERDDRTSIPAQIKQCLDLAKREGLNVIGIIKEQQSARVHGRPKFNNLIAAIKGEEELRCLDPL